MFWYAGFTSSARFNFKNCFIELNGAIGINPYARTFNYRAEDYNDDEKNNSIRYRHFSEVGIKFGYTIKKESSSEL